MKLKNISSLLIFFLVAFVPQESGAQQIPNPAQTESENDSLLDAHSVRLDVPLGTECPRPDFSFVVEKPKKATISLPLAGRLFSETVRAVISVISPSHRLKMRLSLTLRLGQKSDNVSVRRGDKESTVMCMRKWDDALFAEMLARAVLGSIVSESELDDAAHLALRRARATVSADELRSEIAEGSAQ